MSCVTILSALTRWLVSATLIPLSLHTCKSCTVSPRAVLFLLNALIDTYGLLHFYPLLMRIQREIRNILSWRPCTLALTNCFCPDTVCAARPTNSMPRTAIVLWSFVFYLSSGLCSSCGLSGMPCPGARPIHSNLVTRKNSSI